MLPFVLNGRFLVGVVRDGDPDEFLGFRFVGIPWIDSGLTFMICMFF